MAPERHESGGQQQPRAAEVTAEPDGTVVVRFRLGVRLNAVLTEELVRAQIAAAGGQKRPTLADVRDLVSTDRASRELAAGPELTAVVSRMAIVVGNPLTRMLSNFFSRVTGPSYPVRVFEDEARARAWLKERRS
jgi:hypothetical protein